MGTISLHKGQLAGFNSKAPVTLMVGGIRAGKTHVGALKSIVYSMMHPCKEDEYHAVCSPTFPMSAVPVEKVFSLLYDKSIFPVCPLLGYNKRDRVFRLKGHGGVTRLRVFSMHEPNRSRGFKFKSAWYDEGGYGTLESWQVLQGRVADTAGPIWITTTPAGYNWVHDIYENAAEERRLGVPLDQRTHRVVHFTSLQNPYIIDKSGFDRLVGSYDELTYQQEVLAMFVKASGLVYYTFDRNKHVAPKKFDPNLPLWVGQDFNVAKMASSLMQPFVAGIGVQGAHIIGERLAPNSDTFGLVDFLDRFCKTHNFPKEKVEVIPDANGKARSTSGRSDFEILRKAGYRVNAPLSNPFIRDRVNTVNSLFAPRYAVSLPRLMVDPSCKNHIESLTKQSYDGGDPPLPDKAHGHDHIMDAMGYAVTRKLPMRGRLSIGRVPETRRQEIMNQRFSTKKAA